MKKLIYILGLLSFLFFLPACSSDEDSEASPSVTEYESDVIGKWNTEASTEYESFEFNSSGIYVVVPNEGSQRKSAAAAITGRYQIVDDQTITLEGFGTITFETLSSTDLKITLTVDGSSSTKVIDATKVAAISSSTNTELLGKTWRVESLRLSQELLNEALASGASQAEINAELEGQSESIKGLLVTFTTAGTYFVIYPEDSELGSSSTSGDNGIAQWRWLDSNETQLEYSWEESPIWGQDPDNIVKITELNANSLKIDEEGLVYNLVRI